jgi:AcrR family transcriptional regulator
MPKVVPEYKEQARMRIIETAGKLFMEKGYHHSKMTDIAIALGISKGAIYRYFKSKKQLFYEVLERGMSSRTDEILTILASDDPLYITTSDFFDMKIRRAIETRTSGLDLLLEVNKDEKLRKHINNLYENAYQEFLDQIERMKQQGNVKMTADITLLWRGLVALRDGLIISSLLGADIDDAKRVWEYLSRLIINEVLA